MRKGKKRSQKKSNKTGKVIKQIELNPTVKKNRIFTFFKEGLTTRKKRAIVYFGSIILGLTWLFWGIPLPTNLTTNELPISTKIFDRSGKLIYEIYTDQKRTPIELEDLPDYVINATIAIEDKDFYKHYGYSVTGILRAAYKTVFKQQLQGGSTITQQLIKNALLTQDRTLKRKVQEFALATLVETIYSKDQILEMYLNQIPYGSTAYGIEAASEHYFDKPAKSLNLAEASVLAGLPQAPTKYSPFGAHPELASGRQETVLRRMVEDGYITEDEAENAKNTEITYAKFEGSNATHFALWVKEVLSEKYGHKLVEQGGLRVNTTLDLDLQNFAQEAVATEVAKLADADVKNGAALAIRPKSGEILAMVGSKDYFAEDEDGKVNIIFANRQPGSSIKPLNYALALKDKKITLSTAFADVPTCFIHAGQPSYCPKNYDGSFHGLVQTRFALGNSFNIPAVKVLALNGIENFIDFATSLGITTFIDPKNYGLSLTLGGGEVRPYDMAQAFSVFATGGIKQPLVAITKVEDWKGNILEEIKVEDSTGDRVLDQEVTFLISHTLLDNNARAAAFGSSSYLNVKGHSEVSVKTGTTNDRKDNWTIGYTEDVLVLSWVGNNDNSPMSGAVSGVSGASPIWNRIILEALNKAESGSYNESDEGHSWPTQPEGVVGLSVCADIGIVPSEGGNFPGCPTRFEYFLKDSVSDFVEGGQMDVPIDKTTNALAQPETLPELIENRNHRIIVDPLGTMYCATCPIHEWYAKVIYPVTYLPNKPQ